MTKRLTLALSILVALGVPAYAFGGVPVFPGGGGSGGAVSSVTAGVGGCVTVSPTTGAVVITSSGCAGGGVTSAVAGTGIAVSGATGAVTFSLAPVADQRIIGNVSGGSAAPIPLTQAQIVTFLGSSFLVPGNNLSDLGSASTARTNLGVPAGSGTSTGTNTGDRTITLTGAVTGSGTGNIATTLTNKVILQGTTDSTATNAQFLGALATGLLKNTTITGVLSAATAGTDYQAPLTFSTGLTNTSGTVTDNLATGVNSSSQSVFGGTLTTQSLTLRPNAADTTTGRINFTTTASYYDAPSLGFISGNAGSSTVAAFGIGTNAVGFGMTLGGFPALYLGGNYQLYVDSNGPVSVGGTYRTATATGSFAGGGAAQIQANFGTSNEIVSTNGLQFLNNKYAGFTTTSSALTQANGTVFEVGMTPPSQVSASGSKFDGVKLDAVTSTLTGGVGVTTSTGYNYFDIEAPTVTSSSATTVAIASTLTVGAAPIAGGSVTLTESDAFWVRSGQSRFDGSLKFTGATTANGAQSLLIGATGPAGVGTISAAHAYLTFKDSGGTTSYIPYWQ